MPVTLTLKNIPDDVYARLKTASKAHRRSLNSEAIVCFETYLISPKMISTERIRRARELRAVCGVRPFRVKEIATFKQQGRS